jgi:hypothetical protein
MFPQVRSLPMEDEPLLEEEPTLGEGLLHAARRALWAPIAVVVLHSVLGAIFGHEPYVDPAIQLCGGVAVAYFLYVACTSLPGVLGQPTPLGRNLMAFGLTAAMAILWQAGAYVIDSLFGTHLLTNVAETIRDLILGLLGALFFLVGHWLGVRDAERSEG